jgi:DNA-binding response OmpR family regulator
MYNPSPMKKIGAKRILLVQGGGSDSVGPILEQHGYEVNWVRTAKNAHQFLDKQTIALVIIDAPSIRVGIERLCASIKATYQLPIILLGSDEMGVETGGTEILAAATLADACLQRPLQLRRLLTRVEKLMPEGQGPELLCGDIAFYPSNGIVRRRTRETYLNPKLCRLLTLFMQHRGELITRKRLMNQIWETDFMGDTRTLDVHIRWLREAIEEDPTHPIYLRTVRGQGYRFDNPQS